MSKITKEELETNIAEILKDADLATTSTKKVRQTLEKKYGVSLVDRKDEIDKLVMDYVDKMKDEDAEDEVDISEDEEDVKPEVKKEKETTTRQSRNSSKRKNESNDDDDEDKDLEESPKKRNRKAKDDVKKKPRKDITGDMLQREEQIAALEAEIVNLNNLVATLSRRNDVLIEMLDEIAPEGPPFDVRVVDQGRLKTNEAAGGGYTRVCQLSPALSELVGSDQMARHEVVKKVWSLIKEKNLYDPNNKHFAVCDDKMYKVFGVKRFRAFGMMKYLKNHFVD